MPERGTSRQTALPPLLCLCKTRSGVRNLFLAGTCPSQGSASWAGPRPPPGSALELSAGRSHPATWPRLCHPTAQPRALHGSLAQLLSDLEKPASFQATLNLEILPRAHTRSSKLWECPLNICCSKYSPRTRTGRSVSV